MEELSFGEILRDLRESRGYTVNQLAMYSKVSAALISRLENNQRGVPKPETIVKLAEGLKIPYEELMKKAGYLDKESIIEKLVEQAGEPGGEERQIFTKKFMEEFNKLPEEVQQSMYDLIKNMPKK